MNNPETEPDPTSTSTSIAFSSSPSPSPSNIILSNDSFNDHHHHHNSFNHLPLLDSHLLPIHSTSQPDYSQPDYSQPDYSLLNHSIPQKHSATLLTQPNHFSNSCSIPSIPTPRPPSQKQNHSKLKRLASHSIPKLKRSSSKLFASVNTPKIDPQPSSSPPPSPNPALQQQSNSFPTIHLAPHQSTSLHPKKDDPENLFDYVPITTADTGSFEDDGQEGSLQDALDVGDPNSINLNHHRSQNSFNPASSSPSSILPVSTSIHSIDSPCLKPKSTKPFKPGKQFGATPFPATPPSKSPPTTRNSIDSSSIIMRSPKSIDQQSSNPSSSSLTRCPTAPSPDSLRRPNHFSPSSRPPRESALAIVAGGPAALPSRLSGWFQHAFASSTTHLPSLANAPLSPAPPSHASPERIKPNRTQPNPSHPRRATPPDDASNRLPPFNPRRSPVAPPNQAATNARGLGNLFDKAVNYMFDTDAHSYDSRLTSDLWIMGAQQFSGIGKPDDPTDPEGPIDEPGSSSAPHPGGAGSSSDASYPGPSQKRRSALRRVTVNKTKGIFKHHNNSPQQSSGSPPDPLRKAIDLSTSSRRNMAVSFSPSPTPSPEPAFANTSHRSTDEPALLPTTITHSYPPLFYHAFTSVIGLTYRSDFPPIPCAPDRLKGTGISAAGARMGGMLATLSLSIGRAGKKPRTGRGSRSPSPNFLAGDRTDEEDRHSESPAPPPKGLTTDAGWGCMLRTGQSLLANALLVVHLGRDWRRPMASILDCSGSVPTDPAYARLLSWFVDSSSPFAPFSVHRFTTKGKELGKEVGEWFGPSTAAGAIKALTNEFLPAGLGVATDVDGTVYRSDVYSASLLPGSGPASRRPTGSSKSSWQRPVLVLINVRLGLDGVNPSYYETIKATFTFPQSVGIAGGRPSSSYYFCGFQDDSLFYIDPHHSRLAIPLEEPPGPLAIPAQRIALSHRPFGGSARMDGDWEQISSADTDSMLSGSCGSDAIHRPAARSAAPCVTSSPRKPSASTGKSSSVSSHSSRDRLDEFYMRAYSDSALRTFHPDKVRRMTLSALDPSMLVGFLVRDEADWEDLSARIRSFKPPLFHIADVMPLWMRPSPDRGPVRDSADFRPSDDSDLGVDSWSEPEDWGVRSRTDEVSSLESETPSAERDSGGVDGEDEDMGETKDGPARVEAVMVDDEEWDDVEGGVGVASAVRLPAGSIGPAERQEMGRGGMLPDDPCGPTVPLPPEPLPADVPFHARPKAPQVPAQGGHALRQTGSRARRKRPGERKSGLEDEKSSKSPDVPLNQERRGLPPPLIGTENVFPTTHHRAAPRSPLSPTSPSSSLASSSITGTGLLREEPRSRNVSAATVRAGQGEEVPGRAGAGAGAVGGSAVGADVGAAGADGGAVGEGAGAIGEGGEAIGEGTGAIAEGGAALGEGAGAMGEGGRAIAEGGGTIAEGGRAMGEGRAEESGEGRGEKGRGEKKRGERRRVNSKGSLRALVA